MSDFTITINGRNLDCVKNAVKIINNKVFQNDGKITSYDNDLLVAMLGENYKEEYPIGSKFIK